jgi:CheY-like chemotaxis protein
MKQSEWRILVIEDEPDSAEAVREMFEYNGIQSWSAATAEDALKMIPAVQPNVFVVDLTLPGMDGWKFLKTVRENPATAHVPAVAMTAFHSIHVGRQAIEAGFAAYFPKPLDTTSFVRELTRIIP